MTYLTQMKRISCLVKTPQQEILDPNNLDLESPLVTKNQITVCRLKSSGKTDQLMRCGEFKGMVVLRIIIVVPLLTISLLIDR